MSLKAPCDVEGVKVFVFHLFLKEVSKLISGSERDQHLSKDCLLSSELSIVNTALGQHP